MKKQGIDICRPNKIYSIISFDETHQYYRYLRDRLIKRDIKAFINTLAWPDDFIIQNPMHMQ